MNPTNRATLVGSTAVLMWATLALLTRLSGELPPFQLTAMAFTIAFLIGLALWLREGGGVMRHLRQPPHVWLLGVGGLFDFYSGRIPRAPLWLREIGLEWVWRLAQEPGRMWRRYLLGNPLFLYRVWRQARKERRE